MEQNIGYIKYVDISGLWGRLNISWELRPDVNILSGINGCGKSSILKAIYQTISPDLETERKVWIEGMRISFCDGNRVEGRMVSANSIGEVEENFNSASGDLLSVRRIGEKKFYAISGSMETLYDHLNPILIDNFDRPLLELRTIQKLTDENVTTELDLQLYQLEKSYLGYQVGKANQMITFLTSKYEAVRAKANGIVEKKTLFWDMLDDLFQSTGKKIDRSKNDIQFLLSNKILLPYQLSAGEKQILAILLTVLIQDEKPGFLLMDEPEISLHIEWQKDLINNIRKLNPNVQIILATHSPAVIMNGWLDAVTEVGDISSNYIK